MRILNFFTESPICDSVNKLLQKVEYPVEHIPALSSLYLVDMYNICTSILHLRTVPLFFGPAEEYAGSEIGRTFMEGRD